jgi:hypothetical protein
LPVFAQVRGGYSPGSTLTGGGTVPDPGFSYNNQFWYGSSSQLKGPTGNSVPIDGSVTFKIDNNSVLYVPKFKFLGANLEFSEDTAFSSGSLAARDPFTAGSAVSISAFGLTNTTLVPFDLGWHLKWADLQTGYSVSIPTGRYVAGASNNVSTGYWTNFWQSGATVYLSRSKATQASIFSAYAWNTTQRGTVVHPGQNESVDYSLTQTISLAKGDKWPLQVGAAGYGQWQTTKATGQSPSREEFRYRVNGAGITLNLTAPFKGLQFGTSAMSEYGARSTFQGHTIVFSAGFTL